MAKVKILIEGYAIEEKDFEYASPSAVLIQDNNLNIVVDPGMNRKLLLKSIRRENLTVRNIDYVIITHYHPDHCLLASIFENAKVIDNYSINYWDSKIEEHQRKIPGTNIKLIFTPGHDYNHCSVLVENERHEKIVVAGDIFWWLDGAKQNTNQENLLNLKDKYAKDKKLLRKSREKILRIADYIIPGHGKMFKINK
jgi:glyoxylase-like metal-dependent hydrolase (beta-lactamase superfamily II)